MCIYLSVYIYNLRVNSGLYALTYIKIIGYYGIYQNQINYLLEGSYMARATKKADKQCNSPLK